MKTTILASLLAAAAIAYGGDAPETGLLFRSGFDGFSTTPDYCTNPDTAVNGIPRDLQMRMHPNVSGKGNSVCLNGTERVEYSVHRNFDARCGTVSFWVRPENWDFSDSRYFHSFFSTRWSPHYRMDIMVQRNVPKKLYFGISNGKQTWTAYADIPDWKQGEWHLITATWDGSGMKLYADGRPPAPGSRAEVVFKEDPNLPEDYKWGFLWLNQQQSWVADPERKTSYDEFKVYNRVLRPEEILTEYEKFFPSKKNAERPLVTVPGAGEVRIDGKLDEKEWAGASMVPIASTTAANPWKGDVTGTVRLRCDDRNLYLGFSVPFSGDKCNIATRDGELWLNDSVEFHVVGADGKQRQFIVSSNGTVYDSLEGNSKWNSSVRTAAFRGEGSWSCEMAVPFSDLGGKSASCPVNFAMSAPEVRNRFYTWAPLPENTGVAASAFFGTMTLGTASDAVALAGIGNLRSGILDFRIVLPAGASCASSFDCLSGVRGNTDKTVWKQTLPIGGVEFASRVKNAAGKEIYAYYQHGTVNPPLLMNVSGRPDIGKLEVALDFSAAGLPPGTVSGSVKLIGKATGKVWASENFSSDKTVCTVMLPLEKDFPENTVYTVAAVLDTKPSLSLERRFFIPDMTPYRLKVAVDHSTPPAWAPVENGTSGRTLKVLDREYEFGKGPMPVQIVSRGNKLFVRSPEFKLNGKAFQWSEAKFGKNHGDYIEVTSEGTFDGGTVSARGELWFDGMYRWDTTLTPSAPLRIQSFTLGWTTPRDEARYVMGSVCKPWKNDRIELNWDTREYHSLFWTAGYETGLAWWNRSDANWILNPNKPNILLTRNAKEAEVVISIIADPSVLTKPAWYTMVFQGTPARRIDPKFREWQIGNTWFPSAEMGTIGWSTEANLSAPDYIRHWTSLQMQFPDAFRMHLAKLKERNYRALIYGMPCHISRLDDEYDYFFKVWRMNPAVTWHAKDLETGENFQVEPCCGNTGAADLLASHAQKLLDDYPDLGGIYHDIMHIKNCDNPLHGCGGTDAFGKPYSSSIALNLRSYALRIRKLTDSKNKMFLVHAHNVFFPFVHDMGHAWCPGEQMFEAVRNNPEWAYLEAVTPEEWQADWNPNLRGIETQVMGQLERVPRVLGVKGDELARFQSDEYAFHAIAPSLLYDFVVTAFGSEKQDHPIFKLWKIRRDVQLGKSEFHGYWSDPASSPSVPAVKISWYSWKKGSGAPYRAMLCVVNTSRPKVQFSLNPNWNKLGGRPSEIVDLWSGKKLSEDDLNRLELNGHNFLMIGIR